MKFEIDGKDVYAHKAILATRSKYFADMFKKQKDNKHAIKLPKVSYKDIVAILHFIYTNRLPSDCSVESILTVFRVAETFGMPEMKTAATYKALEVLTCKNVVDTYRSASKDSSLVEIEGLCKKFMADNMSDMSKEPSFESLPQAVLVQIVQIASSKMCLDS